MKKSPSLLFDILSETDDKKAKQRIRQSIDLDSAPKLSKAIEGGAAKVEEPKASSSQQSPLDSLLDSLSPETILKELLGDLFVHPDSLEAEDLLGEGAYATVHRATLSPPNGGVRYEVAVKQLKPEVLTEMNDLKDFLMEANLMRKLKSPNIVQIVGIGASNLQSLETVRGSVYLVMEAMNGGNLKELVLRQMLSGGKPIYELSDALSWCIDVANAMTYLHEVCKPMIIHRDLKLENALVGGGASGFAKSKLADFGLHKRAKLNAHGALASESSTVHIQGGGSKSSPPNLYDSVSKVSSKVSLFSDMSFYGGDSYFTGAPASKSIHSVLPSVPEVLLEGRPSNNHFESRPSQSLQQQLAAADKRSNALSKINLGNKPISADDEIHGSEHGGTSALEALKAAGYNVGGHSNDTMPKELTSQQVPPIPGSIAHDILRGVSVHRGSQGKEGMSNRNSGSRKVVSPEEIAAQSFMNPLPPGMVEAPGESLHRKMLALMALDRAAAVAAVAVGPYCPMPSGPYCPMPSLSAPVLSESGQALPSEKIAISSGGGHSAASIQVDVLGSSKVRDGSVSGQLPGPRGQAEENMALKANSGPDGSRGWMFADATQAVGSLMYMAPELFTSHSYNEKVDVFSFAIMAFELFSGRLLALRSEFMVGGQTAVEEYVDRRAKQGERERMPVRWPEPLKDLIAAMWDQNPSKRPCFSQVVVNLKAIRDSRVLDSVSATATSGGGCGCVIS